MRERIGLLGGGGQADETTSFYSGEVAFRAVSAPYINDDARVNLDQPSHEEAETPVCVAVGAPGLKKQLADSWRGNRYISVISDHAIIDESAEIGEGSIVAPTAVITTKVKIGRHVLVNVAASVQHNTSVGDYSSIGPGARVAGNVEIGRGVYVGIGATISNNITITDGVVLGAGATLITDAIIENGVYVGTPAKHIKTNEGWLYEV